MIRGYSVRLDWSADDAAYVATSPEFPGLTGVDEDAETALAELREAMEMAIDVLNEDGEPLPVPRELVEHSGQFRLRVPKSLHATLVRQANEEGVSLNSYVSMLLASAAGHANAQTQASVELRHLLRAIRSEVTGSLALQGGRTADANAVPLADFTSRDAVTNDLYY